jgi:hypothetical protein
MDDVMWYVDGFFVLFFVSLIAIRLQTFGFDCDGTKKKCGHQKTTSGTQIN